MKRKHKVAVAGVGTGVFVGGLIMASIAFACTTYVGKLTVTGPGVGGSSSVAQGDDNCPSDHGGSGPCDQSNGSMSFCGTVQFGATVNHSTGGTITLSSVTTDACTGAQQKETTLTPINQTWDILVITANAETSTDTFIDNADDCMEWQVGASNITTLDSVTDTSGVFTGKTVHIPAETTFMNAASPASSSAGICVSQRGANSDWGNEVPLRYV